MKHALPSEFHNSVKLAAMLDHLEALEEYWARQDRILGQKEVPGIGWEPRAGAMGQTEVAEVEGPKPESIRYSWSQRTRFSCQNLLLRHSSTKTRVFPDHG